MLLSVQLDTDVHTGTGFGEARLAPTYHWFVETPGLTFRESNMLLTDINFWFDSTLDQWPKRIET